MHFDKGYNMKLRDDKKSEYLSENFVGLDLTDQNMVCKVFEDCTFTDCNFSEATFKECKFIDCQFSKCNLSVVKLGYSKFMDVVFDECKLVGVDWTRASWSSVVASSPIKFHKCIINDSSFFGLVLEELVIEDCKAHDVDFREGSFTEANFSYSDFSNSLFNRTNLMGADFIEARNYAIDVFCNEIKRAKFSRFEAINLLDSLEIELID